MIAVKSLPINRWI